jgi:hypothetical protein
MCVRGIDFACFYDILIGLWNCSNSVVFFHFHFINRQSKKISYLDNNCLLYNSDNQILQHCSPEQQKYQQDREQVWLFLQDNNDQLGRSAGWM